ncbi:hypothetical protein YC2023_107243 [Brassica napus]
MSRWSCPVLSMSPIGLVHLKIPDGKPRLISTRPFIRAHTVIGGKVAKATQTQSGHSSWSSITTRPRAFDQVGRVIVIQKTLIEHAEKLRQVKAVLEEVL